MITEGKHTACITVSHTQKKEKVAIPAICQILLNAHTHTQAAFIKTKEDKDTDTYAHVQDIFYYSNTLMHSNEHSLPSSFRQRERERDINLKKRKR